MQRRQTGGADGRKFVCIQALRAAAALSVVAFHLQPFVARYLHGAPAAPRALALGEVGVDAFFVVSGFIITATTARAPSSPAAALSFLGHRFTRIYPIYWLYCSAIVLAGQVVPGLFFHRHEDIDYVASFLLTPPHGETVLLVSWTLTFEVQFYLLFAAASGVAARRGRAWAGCFWAAAIMLRPLWMGSSPGPLAELTDPLNLEFLMGCAVAGLHGTCSRRYGPAVVAAGAVVLLSGFVLLGSDDTIPDGWPRVLFAGGGFSLVMIGALALEAEIRKVTPRALIAVGDSSYSLYLTHLPTIGLVGLLWRAFDPAGGAAVEVAALSSAVLASVLVGWLSYRYIERPQLRLFKGAKPARLRAPSRADGLVPAAATCGERHRDPAS